MLIASSCAAEAAPITAAWPISFGSSFIHAQGATAQLRAVEGRNRFFRFAGIRHLDKSKAACAPGIAIGDDVYIFHRAVRGEKAAQVRVGCVVGQVANVKALHCVSSGSSETAGSF